jgi:hypothetical protein
MNRVVLPSLGVGWVGSLASWVTAAHPIFSLLATIPPGRLNDVTNAADHITLVQDNFEVLSEELFKVTPTYQNGAHNTLIGPPTSGERVLGELWKDSLGAWWRCTAAGTPGTWQQVLPAALTADPVGRRSIDFISLSRWPGLGMLPRLCSR